VSSTAVVVIVLILIVAVVLGLVMARRRRSTQLQERFGPEYERTVSAASGDRRAAETVLSERQQRREQFDVRDLDDAERGRFRESWNEIQRGFVDDPRQSLHSADLLVAEVMRTRGYPVDDDFDRRADDLSVDHPRVVEHYRDARRVRDAGGEVDTENQRTAITSYRSLIDALLGDDEAHVGGGTAAHDADRPVTDRAVADRPTTDRSADPASADRRPVEGAADQRADAVADRRADNAADRRADDPADGRHAVREPEAPRDATRPTDPNGTQNPRTEERTR
jgi:hypothetical protein